MRKRTGVVGAVLISACFLTGTSRARADVDQIQQSFLRPPDDARIMARWWWFGPAVTQPELRREMQAMRDGGFGGFEVQPTYPLALDDHPKGLVNLKFLSPEFLDALKFTAATARELGLRMDLTLGSGWPYGGPMFPVADAAGRLRTEWTQAAAGQTSVTAPALRAGEKWIAAFAVAGSGDTVDYSKLKEITMDGNVARFPADFQGAAQVLFFISSHTGMQVKRPAFGAEGNVIDHLSSDVVRKFIQQVAEPEVAATGSNTPYALFCDSLEVTGEDWTDQFLSEFQKRRGYDLRPLLPALVGDIGPKTLEIRHDWGQTLTELFGEEFVAPLEKFAKEHNSRFRIQAYGSPSAAEESYAFADLPEGEGYQWHGYRASRYASSACHLLGVPVSSSETFTWIRSPVFRATPLDVKAEADEHFLQGINQIICHGWPYTAENVDYPGWSFYASGVFDEKNPWWIVMPDLAKYLQRVSFIMRQGQPANDVLVYLANDDAWASFVPGRISLTDDVGTLLGRDIVGQIIDSGYNLDFVDDGLLQKRGKVDGGTLAFGDLRYKVIVLAGVKRIPVATMRMLEQFAHNGGIVVATRNLPSAAPGYLATDDDQKTVADIANRLFVGPNAPGLFVQDESKFGATLAGRLAPDVACTPSAAPDFGFVHRHTDDSEIYFLDNNGNQALHLMASFRVGNLHAEWWNPFSGAVNPASVSPSADGRSLVDMDLQPYESRILVWSRRASQPAAAIRVASIPEPIELTDGWTVQLGANAQPAPMPHLHSWADDAASRYFSGVATYRNTLNLPADWHQPGLRISMTFGESAIARPPGRGVNGSQALLDPPIREAAIVTVNDKIAGSIWCPPYSIDLTELLQPGSNAIRIDVANTAINYMAGHTFPNYDYQSVIQFYGNRFQPQNLNLIQPLPSGLLGPIRLVAREASQP